MTLPWLAFCFWDLGLVMRYVNGCHFSKSSLQTLMNLQFSLLSTWKVTFSGLLIFRGKKTKISRDFQGQIRGKIGQFRGKKVIIRGKNRPISRDFRGRKVKIRRKIARFRGILAEKSQISKDFQGQILRKIGRFPGLFHGKFRGETSPRNNR